MAAVQKSQTPARLNPVLRLKLNMMISRELGHQQPPRMLVSAASNIIRELSNDKNTRLNEQNGMDKALELSKAFGLPYTESMNAYVRDHVRTKLYFALNGMCFKDEDSFKSVVEYAKLHGISTSGLAKIEMDIAKELFENGNYKHSEILAKRNEMRELAARSRVLLELS